MQGHTGRTDIGELLAELGLWTDGQTLLIIGRTQEHVSVPQDTRALGKLASADDIPAGARADLAVIIDQLEYMTKPAATVLLSRVRDVHCHRVLLALRDDAWSRNELLALGYRRLERPSEDVRLYLFDPDEFNPPREWNNSTNWANPQNFKKYRW